MDAHAAPLVQLEYRLAGLSLSVSPTALTLPRGIATQLDTTVTGAVPTTAAVHATLRGPSFPGTIDIRATPGEPIFLPPFTQAGTHFLEDIRLEVDAETTIPAAPATVTINVLAEILVGSVTSHPLSLDEIRHLGIQFDANDFQAFMFTIAFTTESGIVNLDVPVLVPVSAGGQMMVGSEIPGLDLAQLKVPGLDLAQLGLVPFDLEVVEEGEPTEEPPRISGIVVIPGTVAFLNQFFSVQLAVMNQAPAGTPLTVRDVRAEITLPAGGDGVAGDITRDPPFRPSDPEFDNPLRIAKTAAGREKVKPVLAPGADGTPGTADDVDRLTPQGSGMAEFLVEGIREGAQIVDIEITGTLEGLRSGPVQVRGHARGAVVVRDPDFALTFIHPDTVRAGELYELLVQLRNTGKADANLVTVSLDARNLSGARFVNPADATCVIDTIHPGDAGSCTFRLEALRTGRVTASSLDTSGAGGIVTSRRLSLKAGVTEQGVPASPDTLILPQAVTTLRDRSSSDLIFRAVALLGEAHSIATAPRGSLPPGVKPIGGDVVLQRARELATAAFRLELSYREGAGGVAEPLPDGLLLTLEDFLFDWLGQRAFDDGWDALYRSSRQARLLGEAMTDVLRREAAPLGLDDLLALQRQWADTESYRPDYITVVTQATTAGVPVKLRVNDRRGRRVGGRLDPALAKHEIPGADVLRFADGATSIGQLVAVTKPDTSPYTATLTGRRAGTFDLGIVAPGADGDAQQFVFRDVSIAAGQRLTVTIRPRGSPTVVFERGDAPTSIEPIPDGPPRVLGVVQNADPSVDRFGRVVGILFDEDVERDSAQNPAGYTVSSATIPMVPPPELIDGNRAVGSFVQFGGRIVLLGLRDPVGPFVRRTLDVAGVRDLEGRVMAPVTARRILPDPDIGLGGQVRGRIRRSDGTTIAQADVTYVHDIDTIFGCAPATISVKPADGDGAYDFDYISGTAPCPRFGIQARDPATGEEGSLTTAIRSDGERRTLDIVLVGRGSVQGTVRDANGTPLPDVTVDVTSETDGSRHPGRTDQNGVYRVDRVPVGGIGVTATAAVGTARASSSITASGTTTTVDLTIVAPAVGVVVGDVVFPDGSSAPDLEVFIFGDRTGPQGGSFLDSTRTDEAGTFRFEKVPSGTYTLRGLDRANALLGDASTTVLADVEQPVFVHIILGGTGTVSGVVRERMGSTSQPVAGAQVAGGTQLVTTDAEGRYLIPVVPVGVRTIQAINPADGAQGSRSVTILTAGQAATGIDIVLEPLGSIQGRVFDPDGHPLADQEVVLVVGEGASLSGGRAFFVRRTRTGADATYRFDRLELKDYPLTAKRGNDVANAGAQLSRLVLDDVVDLHMMRSAARVTGHVVDETGLAVAAKVTLKARVPNAVGLLEFTTVGTTTSDPDRGFAFGNVFPGPFTATATSFFAPTAATESGTLPTSTSVADVRLVLAKNTGTLLGCVRAPDGAIVPPVVDDQEIPLPLSVFITSAALRNDLARDPLNPKPDGIHVDAGDDGCFVSSIPLPPDHYTVQVTDGRPGPTAGLTGQAEVDVAQGQAAEQDVRLLGLGTIAVEVVDVMGTAIPGVSVSVRRTTYPTDGGDAFATEPTDVAPVVFGGLTEGPVAVAAVVSNDPMVDVGGRDELRGFGGHAMGVVMRDGIQMVRVVVDGAGVVVGRFLRPDGVTPVPNAQVELGAGAGVMAFEVTDVDGAFRFDGVPVGGFSLAGFDPATGRRAQASAQLQVDGQRVTQDLRLGPLGTVRGVVLDATGGEPVAGATVGLALGTATTPARTVTTGLDGSFTFQSVPGGPFTVVADALNGLSGRGAGRLSSEGEVVELTVLLEGSGRVEGTVRGADGAPIASAAVTLVTALGRRLDAQAGTGAQSGHFAIDLVPLGPFTVEARPPGALTPGDGGRAAGEVTANGQLVTVDVTFQGTVTIGVVVRGTIGPSAVDVALTSGGLFGGRAQPTGIDGDALLFDNVPRAPLSVSASQVTPTGITISAAASLAADDLPPSGGRLVPDLTLDLSEAGVIRGQVVDPAGLPVSGARVRLAAATLHTLALTGADGRFEFLGVPLDVSLRLDADTSQGGLAAFAGRIDRDGVIHDLDDLPHGDIVLVLDVAAPTVTAVQPAAGRSDVPTTTSLVVTFSEPIDPATVTTCSGATVSSAPAFLLLAATSAPPALNDPLDPCDDSNVISLQAAVSADQRSVVLTPLAPLGGVTRYTAVVSAGRIDTAGMLAGGVRDLVGKPLDQDFVWTFTTRDVVPPRVLTLSPPDGAVGVPVESLVRVTLSEPVDPTSVDAVSFAVNGPSGPVMGRRDLILGNTVAVFTPTDAAAARALLESNATYHVTIGQLRDAAGNLQRDTAEATFATADTIAPVVDRLTTPAAVRAGEPVLVSAFTEDPDVARVEFFVDGVLSASVFAPSAPGEFQAILSMPARSIQVVARAVDASGNVGEVSAPTLVALLADGRPVVAITAPPAGTLVLPGATVQFMVHATDDVAVVELRGAASGAVTALLSQLPTPAPSVTASFDVAIPAASTGGPLTFAVTAVDGRGQTSDPATVVVRVASCVTNAACSDGNSCTDDRCTDGRCEHAPTTAGAVCDDGSPCTPTDRCDGNGACVGTGTVCGNGTVDAGCGEECDDGNVTPGDGCNAACRRESTTTTTTSVTTTSSLQTTTSTLQVTTSTTQVTTSTVQTTTSTLPTSTTTTVTTTTTTSTTLQPCTTRAVANVLANGDFATPDIGDTPFVTHTTAPPGFGWVVTQAPGNAFGVDVIGSSWPGVGGPASSTGHDQSLDIDFDNSIAQTFPTIPGATYTLSLFYAHNVASSSSSGTVTVTGATVLVNATLTHALPATVADMQWVHFTRTFVADRPTATLRIVGAVANGVAGFVVDDVGIVGPSVELCDDGLVAYYPFEDAGSPGRDEAGSHDGVVRGPIFESTAVAPVWWSRGAMLFDGADEIEIPDDNALDFGSTSPMTLALWLRSTQTGGTQHILGKRAASCTSINYQLAADSIIGFNSDAGRVDTGVGIVASATTFTHLAVTYDGAGTLKVFLDGVERARRTSYLLRTVNAASLKIGASDACGSTFKGILDDVRVYNRALAASEIQTLAGANDFDADGYSDRDETESGSDPRDAGSIPTATLPLNQAFGGVVSVLNGVSPDGALLDLTSAVSPVTSVLNAIDPAATPQGAASVDLTSAVSPVTSVLNAIDPADTPEGAASVDLTSAVSPVVSVLNAIDPAATPSGSTSVDLTNATSPVVSVLNELDPTAGIAPGDFTNNTATCPVVSVDNQASP